MLKKIILAYLTFIMLSSGSFSQPSVSWLDADATLEERGEVYFSFEHPGNDLMIELINRISVDHIMKDKVFAYANRSEFEQFLAFQLPYIVHVPPGLQHADKQFNMLSEVDASGIIDWGFYPTYEAYESMMQQYAEMFPDLCEMVELKTLPSGRRLLFAVIGKAPEDTQKPRFMYTSTMHGDETTGFNLMLRLIHHLLNGYGKDARVTRLIDELEIWICPNENPDGTYTSDNSTVMGATRSNSNNFDLNRNYPHVSTGLSFTNQPETLAMIALVDSIDFVMSANIHTGFECVNYPWDYWRSTARKHADHDWWQFVSQEYADTARYYSHDNYMDPRGPSFFNGVTHGGDWYGVQGSRQDFMNYYANLRELTLELSLVKMLPTDSLENHWTYNYRSLLNYMEQTLYGIQGVVADAAMGKALAAEISFPAYDKDNSEVYSSMPLGRFFRPLPVGTYDLMVSSADYPNYIYQGLEVLNYETLFLEIDPGMIQFNPLEVSFPAATAPGQSYANLHLYNPGDETISFQFKEFTGDKVFDFVMPLKQAFTLPRGGEDLILLTFNPQHSGQHLGEIIFSINKTWYPDVTIPLLGFSPEEAAILFLLIESLNFGSVRIKEESTLNLSIRNAGNMPLIIEEVIFSDNAFRIETVLPVTIEAGNFYDISVTFLPDTAGAHEALARIISNNYEGDLQIILSGAGVDDTSVALFERESAFANIFPNPAGRNALMRIQASDSGVVSFEIFNSKGVKISRANKELFTPGIIDIDLGPYLVNMKPGVYHCRIMTGTHTTTIRLIKMP